MGIVSVSWLGSCLGDLFKASGWEIVWGAWGNNLGEMAVDQLGDFVERIIWETCLGKCLGNRLR